MSEIRLSFGWKIFETFTVSFFGAMCASLGTLISNKSVFIIALFSGIGGIIGYVLFHFLPNVFQFKLKGFSPPKLKLLSIKQDLLPLIFTGLILIFSTISYFIIRVTILSSLDSTIQNPHFFTWLINFSVIGSISGIILTTISDIKVYGFEKSLSGILEFCFSRIFFTIMLTVFVFIASCIILFIALCFLSLFKLLGFDIFMSSENMLDNITFICTFISIETYLLFNINKAMFEMNK